MAAPYSSVIYHMKAEYLAVDYAPHRRECERSLLRGTLLQLEGGPERIKKAISLPASWMGDRESLHDYIVEVTDPNAVIWAEQADDEKRSDSGIWLPFVDTRTSAPSTVLTVVLQMSQSKGLPDSCRPQGKRRYHILSAYLGPAAAPGPWDKKGIYREAEEVCQRDAIPFKAALEQVKKAVTDYWSCHAYRLGSKDMICTACANADIAKADVINAWDGGKNILCHRCEELSRGALMRMKHRVSTDLHHERARPTAVKCTNGIRIKRRTRT